MNPLNVIDEKLRAITAKREELDREIKGLQEARKILLPLYEPDEAAKSIPSIEEFIEGQDVGITDAVRGALRLNSVHRLTATQIRDIVGSHGFDLGKYANAMATIHQVIQRLVKAGQVIPVTQGAEKMFQWIERSVPNPSSLARTLHPAYRPVSVDPVAAPPERQERGPLAPLIEQSERNRNAMRENFERGPNKEKK
jgi:hypothetical protein